jgi:hypothetical protein
MGILDNEHVTPYAQACDSQIRQLAAGYNIEISVFAREIVSLFITSAMFEPARSQDQLSDAASQGSELYEQLRGDLPSVFADLVETTTVRTREDDSRNVIMSADVYHWIAARSEAVLAELHCPWAS